MLFQVKERVVPEKEEETVEEEAITHEENPYGKYMVIVNLSYCPHIKHHHHRRRLRRPCFSLKMV